MIKVKISISLFILAIVFVVLLPFWSGDLFVISVFGIPVCLLFGAIYGFWSWRKEDAKVLAAIFGILQLVILIGLIILTYVAIEGFVDSLN